MKPVAESHRHCRSQERLYASSEVTAARKAKVCSETSKMPTCRILQAGKLAEVARAEKQLQAVQRPEDAAHRRGAACAPAQLPLRLLPALHRRCPNFALGPYQSPDPWCTTSQGCTPLMKLSPITSTRSGGGGYAPPEV